MTKLFIMWMMQPLQKRHILLHPLQKAMCQCCTVAVPIKGFVQKIHVFLVQSEDICKYFKGFVLMQHGMHDAGLLRWSPLCCKSASPSLFSVISPSDSLFFSQPVNTAHLYILMFFNQVFV